MQKDAPSLGRILTMVFFALSCFGLLLFLWLSFGGPIPLKPEGYRFQVAVPEAATLAEEADVRIAGVNVGKIKSKELDKGAARTIVEVELDDKYAPIPEDSRAILRQKTLLGETYMELTPGSTGANKLDEGDELARAQVEETQELDEILRIFDPETKQAIRNYTKYQAQAIKGRAAEALNNALGNLAPFATDGAGTLETLDEQKVAVKELIKNTGVVFRALNQQDGQLRGLIQNANNVFDATASQKESLAESFQIFPTFLRESRLTLNRLERFSRNTNPLVRDLRPVADDLGPTVRDLGDLAPDLRALFRDLDPLIDSSEDTLPAAARFLRGARDPLRGLHTFLPELNPILAYANFDQGTLGDFLTVGGAAVNTKLRRGTPGFEDANPAPVHLLPQFGVISGRSNAVNRSTRPIFERGNSYLLPNFALLGSPHGTIESILCSNTDNGPGSAKTPEANGEIDTTQPFSLDPNADPEDRPSDPGNKGDDTGAGTLPGRFFTMLSCALQGNFPAFFTNGGGKFPVLKGAQPPITYDGGERLVTPRSPSLGNNQDP